MGDMNQPLTSDITGWFTKELLSAEDAKQLVLRDSWEIYKQDKGDLRRPATYFHFNEGNILDYILLSQEFQTDSPYSLADITQHQTYNEHLVHNDFERDQQASDHAFVSVTACFNLT
jgi:hypothetical protein